MPTVSEPLGRVLGSRYRVLSALGTGASAHVFLAEDMVLQRRVAVKVLQPALARDEAFLRRFRAEARSVAAMNHPYVLRVFDWGEDEDGPFLVLEFLEGGSLYDVLARGARLSPAQAARAGVQAAEGLAYAHARGLVHRDVKPANILFDEEGRVRVADFGVARALAGAGTTEPAGTMIGTARYASPEQAQARPLDGRSDVYSLGLVLYEAVTGRVPFEGDTPVATLQARIGATLPRHLALGALYETLAWACSPEVTERPDAADLALRLENVADAMAPARPLPISRSRHAERPAAAGAAAGVAAATAGPPGPGAVVPADATGVLPTEGLRHRPVEDPTAAVELPTGPTDIVVRSPGRATGRPPPGKILGPKKPERPPRMQSWRWRLAAALAVLAVLVAGGIVTAAKFRVFTPSRPVPAVVGMSLDAARHALDADHFHVDVAPAVTSTDVPTGSVVSQEPSKGTALKQGDTVTVVPSSGLPMVAVPSLSGDNTCTSAETLLTAAHLKAQCPALAVYTATVPKGDVINWSYSVNTTGTPTLDPTQAIYGGTIKIAISEGRAPVKVPDFGAETYTSFVAALKGIGLLASETQSYSTTVPAMQVVSTTPAPGATLFAGSTVTVTVSKGPHIVTVPDLGKDTVAQATATLQAATLTVGAVYGPPTGKVFTTVPLAGTQVKAGTPVTLYTQ